MTVRSRNLYAASHQWSNRPADERFWTLQEMRDQCYEYYANRTETETALRRLVVADDKHGELYVGIPDAKRHDMRMTNWGFKQLCADLGAPAAYLGDLPADLSKELLRHHLDEVSADKRVQVIGYKPKEGPEIFRFYNGPSYSRMWNYQLCDQLLEVTRADRGWRTPPARPATAGPTRFATKADVLTGQDHSLSIKVGDEIGPAGLYASDHDMFAFLVNEEHRIPDGTDAGLARGIFISNYEVPGYAFKVWRFLYRFVCGNHIVWGAENVATFRIIHVNVSFQQAWEAMSKELQGWLDRSSKEDIEKIKKLQRYCLGDDMEEVIDKLYAFRFGITRKQLTDAYTLVHTNEVVNAQDGDPRTPWGMINGLTRLSQEIPYADERARLETAVGRLMMVNF